MFSVGAAMDLPRNFDPASLPNKWGVVPDYGKALAEGKGKLVRLHLAIWFVIGFGLEATARAVAAKMAAVLAGSKKSAAEMAAKKIVGKIGGEIAEEIGGKITQGADIWRTVKFQREQETLIAEIAEKWAWRAAKFRLGKKDRARRVKLVRIRIPEEAEKREKTIDQENAKYAAYLRKSRREEILREAQEGKARTFSGTEKVKPKWWEIWK